MGYHYIQPDTNPYAGLFSALGIMMANNQNNREQQARDKAQLDARNYVNNMQINDPNGAIGTNYNTIQQLTQNPTPQASEFKNGILPTDAGFLKELADDYNQKTIGDSTKNIQGLVPGWQAYKQADPTKYKADMQAVVDNNGNNGQGLLSGLQGIARQYGTGGTFGNDVRYLAAQTGDPSLTDATKTQQQPQLNEKPTIAITPQYIKQQITSLTPGIISDLHAKGVPLKEAMPMVQQMLNSRIEDLTSQQADKDLQSEYGNVQNSLQADFNNPTARRNAIQAMIQYNQKAHNWGKNPLDVGMIDKLMATGMVKLSQIEVPDENGVAQTQDIMIPVNGGYLTDSNGQQVPYIPIGSPRKKGISPDTYYNGNLKIQLQANDAANKQAIVNSKGGYVVNNGRVEKTKNADPKKVGEWSTRYNDILADIWNSKTPAERAQKISEYKPELNSLGEALDVDVQNDVGFILGK